MDTLFAIGDEVEVTQGEYKGESGTIAECLFAHSLDVSTCDFWVNVYGHEDSWLLPVKRADIRLVQYENTTI